MNSSANVQAIDALTTLKNALVRFSSDAQNALQAIEMEIQRTHTWLQERLQHWQSELRRREQILRQAELALQRCLNSGSRDRPPDCSQLYATVMQARRLVQEAEHELRIVQMHIRRLEEAESSYRKQVLRLSGALNSELPKGTSLLSRSSAILESYVTDRGGEIGFGGLFGGGGPGSGIEWSGVGVIAPSDTGAFAVSNWSGYPASATRPVGPFRMLPPDVYKDALANGRKGTKTFHDAHPEFKGMHIHHIHPVKFGGDPYNPVNLQALSPSDHRAITVWWNRVQRELVKRGYV